MHVTDPSSPLTGSMPLYVIHIPPPHAGFTCMHVTDPSSPLNGSMPLYVIHPSSPCRVHLHARHRPLLSLERFNASICHTSLLPM